MKPPENTKLIETRAATLWFDKDGILYSISKKVSAETLEETKKSVEEFKKLFGDKKFCMILDVTNSAPTTREVRQYAAEELEKIIKAAAIIADSAFAKMLTNLFFNLKPPPYPIKMFNNEIDAKEWVLQYCK